MRRNSPIIKPLTAAILSLCLGLLVACGRGDNESRESTISFDQSTVASCLKQGEARFANSADELDFLYAAESNDEVSKVGFAQDGTGKIVIDTWHKATFEGRPPEWTIWIGHPFGEPSSPGEIANSGSSNSYVAYSVRPSKQQRAELEKCIDVESDDAQPTTTIDKSDLEEVEP
jgi:hypothetical protein